MENLNAEQIKKALECCISGDDCTICPLCDEQCCPCVLNENALALINSQEQKIFELENRLKECENGYKGTNFLDRCKLHDAEEKVRKLTEENERLTEKAYRLECDLQLNADERAVAKAIEHTKKATVRKMQELLYKDFNTTTKPDMYIKSIIDKRVKEMLEDKQCT